MSGTQLLEKYQSLPQHLKQAVELYIDFLAQMTTDDKPGSDMVIQRAKSPDVSSIFNLTAQNPLNLKEIRRKAWKR